MSSLTLGCGGRYDGELPRHPDPFKPDELKDMLEISMNNYDQTSNNYNEVLINSSHFVHNLPRSIAAIVYFNDVPVADKIQATKAYIQMLDHFPNMNEERIPLLEINRLGLKYETAEPVIVDRSKTARTFVSGHDYQTYRSNHPHQHFPKRYRWSKQRDGVDDSTEREEEFRRRRLREFRYGRTEDHAGTCRSLKQNHASDKWCQETCSEFFCPPDVCSEACFSLQLKDPLLGMSRKLDEEAPMQESKGCRSIAAPILGISDLWCKHTCTPRYCPESMCSRECLAEAGPLKEQDEDEASESEAVGPEPGEEYDRIRALNEENAKQAAENAEKVHKEATDTATAKQTEAKENAEKVRQEATPPEGYKTPLDVYNEAKEAAEKARAEKVDDMKSKSEQAATNIAAGNAAAYDDATSANKASYDEGRQATEAAAAAAAAPDGQSGFPPTNWEGEKARREAEAQANAKRMEEEKARRETERIDREAMAEKAKQDAADAQAKIIKDEEEAKAKAVADAAEAEAAEAQRAKEAEEAEAKKVAEEEAAKREAEEAEAKKVAEEEAAKREAEEAKREADEKEAKERFQQQEGSQELQAESKALADEAASAAPVYQSPLDAYNEAKAQAEKATEASASDAKASFDDAIAKGRADIDEANEASAANAAAAVPQPDVEPISSSADASLCRSLATPQLQAHGITDKWCADTCSQNVTCPMNVCSKECKLLHPDVAGTGRASPTGAGTASPEPLTNRSGNGTCVSIAPPSLVATGVDDAWCLKTCTMAPSARASTQGCPYDVCSKECMELSTEEDPDIGSAVKELPHDAVDDEPEDTEPAPRIPKVDPNHMYQSGWTLGELARLYRSGLPSNNLSHVGLTIHAFDGTEDERKPWVPCTAQWCKPGPVCNWVKITQDPRTWPPRQPKWKNWTYYNHQIQKKGERSWKNCTVRDSAWVSASIINPRQHHTFSSSGILLTPDKTKVLCSWPDDMSSLENGCDSDFRAQRPTHPQAFYPLELKDMLNISMNPKNMGNSLYNEVLIDADTYRDNLPQSIAAIVYFDDSSVPDKVVAVHSYLQLLDEYNLTGKDLPLLKVTRKQKGYGLLDASEIVVDESAAARKYLMHHSYEKYRKATQRLPPLAIQREHDTEEYRKTHGGTLKDMQEGRTGDGACHSIAPPQLVAAGVDDEWCINACTIRGNGPGCPKKHCSKECFDLAPTVDPDDPSVQQPFRRKLFKREEAHDVFEGEETHDAFQRFRRSLYPRELHRTVERARSMPWLPVDPFANEVNEELRRLPTGQSWGAAALSVLYGRR